MKLDSKKNRKAFNDLIQLQKRAKIVRPATDFMTFKEIVEDGTTQEEFDAFIQRETKEAENALWIWENVDSPNKA